MNTTFPISHFCSTQSSPHFASTSVLVWSRHATYFISSFCKVTQIPPHHSCVYHDKYSMLLLLLASCQNE